jgi:antitoxin ParD1/3/4
LARTHAFALEIAAAQAYIRAMASKAIPIDLGDMASHAERHLKTGEYRSLDEVVRAGLRALDREQAEIDAHHRRLIDEALADPRPMLPAEEAFAEIRRRVAERRKR